MEIAAGTAGTAYKILQFGEEPDIMTEMLPELNDTILMSTTTITAATKQPQRDLEWTSSQLA